MAWKKTKVKNKSGTTITAWKNEKGEISYSNPKAVRAGKEVLKVGAKGLSGIRDIASFTRTALTDRGKGYKGGELIGPLPNKRLLAIQKREREGALEREENEWGPGGQPSASRQLQIAERANLEAGAVEREENEWGPGGQPSASAIADLQLRNKGLAETKKYKKGKTEKERQAGWAEADLQDAKDLGAGSASGMREWTTDQKASDQGSFTAIPPDKGGKGGVSESKASGSSSGTSKKMGAIERENRKRFGDKKIDDLKIRHSDWKKARKAGTLDKWRKKYGVS